ncbi:hypothetical protein AK812_SmicGene12242 [Symbiodinium microadriaticum]|uniref:Uncharacterized protein n=1 Tax=Symbiodinium microadriaticum TaxID=2951 RepID=A0A1Q9EB88_SYMMI|nr:hypothetical protein AK812_SmicGene12242 [Symbiodinium microadriaticum]
MCRLRVLATGLVLLAIFSLVILQHALTRPACPIAEPAAPAASVATAPPAALEVATAEVPAATTARSPVCVGPRLVLHVGPHKTGTTAFQEFLIKHADWLKEEFGVTVGFREAKEGAGKLNHIMSKYRQLKGIIHSKAEILKRLEDAVRFTKAALQRSSLVLVSAEGYSQFDAEMWHAIMGCPALSPLVNCLRDDIEAELAAGIGNIPADPCPESLRRWPILTAWRWLVPIPQREASLFQDVNGSSATACSRETGSDLAYRGIFPKAMGAAICRMSPSDLEAMANQELEQYATLRQSSALQSELRILAASRRRALPAIQFAQRLMLGLRCVRSAYQVRLSAWLHLASTALSDPTRPDEEDEASQVVINPPSRDLQRWLASPTGNAFVREIRWALLPCEVAVRRLRAVAPCQRLRDQALAHALLDSGAAFLVAGNAHWGPPRPTWSEAVYAMAVTCHCSPPAHLACVAACWTCGGVCLPTWDSPAKPCPWCRGHPGTVCGSYSIWRVANLLH